jgi:hypothetical protein
MWQISKYLETTVTNQVCIHEEIRSKLCSGNECYQSVHSLSSSLLLSRNLKIKIYKTIILPVILYRSETEGHRSRVLGKFSGENIWI